MSIASLFEDFSLGPMPASQEATETGEQLASYETGYKAGWDDATKAQEELSVHLSTALSRNIEQIEFTVAEAKSDILKGLRTVLSEVVQTVLPSMGETALRALVLEEIEALLDTASPSEITLLTSKTDFAAVSALRSQRPDLSAIHLEARDTLGDGQIYVTCKQDQRKIDLAQAIADINTSIQNFLDQPELEHAHAK